ncbi:MAG: hypothetical protein NZ901_04015 [Geminocystis sp.]|nr:hypothetical protein [Geminocystis sp.]HIK38574.1 hypothetical protein [Geminocystis sp. M7585_C2015_104]MCS7147337.1 hypothetical protein [Geminocystis sp.]MCX8079081.1 hypothetical protein [Geminocystis sp.]MDW8116336.1 hypothetical protein [Geminocystis sp.]
MSEGSQKNTEEKSSYEPPENPNKITAKAEYLRAIADVLRAFTPYVWLAVIILVIVPIIGQITVANSFKAPPSKPAKEILIETRKIDWEKVDEAVRNSVKVAYKNTERYAAGKLDDWFEYLEKKINPSFLDWYFSYWNQKRIEYRGLLALGRAGISKILGKSEKDINTQVAEEITADFQREFAKRVLSPETAQLKIERITQQTVEYYLEQVKNAIDNVKAEFKIPQEEWDRYLRDLAVTTYYVGSVSNTPSKLFVGASASLLVKSLSAAGGKITAKLGTKIATKTGGKLAAKMAFYALDAAIGFGILLWDFWDVYHNAQVERPILEKNLMEYLQELKYQLLRAPNIGIMSVIDRIQEELFSHLK